MKTAFVSVALSVALAALALAYAPAPLPRSEKVRRVDVGKNVALEVRGDRAQKRRVIVTAVVCLREGTLEHLLTRKTCKEHEAILAADVDARDIHKALLLAGAVPGSPVTSGPNSTEPSGQAIRITLAWDEKGNPRRAAAQDWVRHVKTKTAMAHDWVFAGSQLIHDPQFLQRPRYLANDGDVICVANFEGAMLDVPVASSKSTEELAYEAFTENIPPLGTEVSVLLEPVSGKD